MDKPVLGDKDQFPTEEVIRTHLGPAKSLWKSFFDHLHTVHPDLAEEWRYYNDGKSWLMKVTHKKKTVFWLSLLRHSFCITFYFTAKAEAAILASSIPDEMKREFQEGKNIGKIKGLTIVFRQESQLVAAHTLVAIKKALK